MQEAILIFQGFHLNLRGFELVSREKCLIEVETLIKGIETWVLEHRIMKSINCLNIIAFRVHILLNLSLALAIEPSSRIIFLLIRSVLCNSSSQIAYMVMSTNCCYGLLLLWIDEPISNVMENQHRAHLLHRNLG